MAGPGYPQRGHTSVVKHDGSTPQSWFPYSCASCDTKVSGAVVASYANVRGLMCTNCGEGSVQTSSQAVFPGVNPGPALLGLPDAVAAAYSEARASMSVAAFTASELICRKLLMPSLRRRERRKASPSLTTLNP